VLSRRSARRLLADRLDRLCHFYRGDRRHRLDGRPIIGVAIFYLLQYYLAALGSWYLMSLGGLAIALMLFAPSGIWGVISHSLGISLFPVRRRLVAIAGSVRNTTASDSSPLRPRFPSKKFRQIIAE